MDKPHLPPPSGRSLWTRLRGASWRDLLILGLPVVLVLGAAVWVGVRSLRFAPRGPSA